LIFVQFGNYFVVIDYLFTIIDLFIISYFIVFINLDYPLFIDIFMDHSLILLFIITTIDNLFNL